MTTSLKIIGFITASFILAIALYMVSQAPNVFGQAFTGNATNIVSATSTSVGVGGNKTLFEANAQCDSRIITTKDTAIRLSFRTITGFTATNVIGHLQAASTTVVYDSGVYGCGKVTARGLSASTTITISETQ